MSMKTENIIKDLKNLEDIFDFSNLDENHEIFSDDNKKVFSKFKLETPENIWINELVRLRSKTYSFECGDESKNEIKGTSKSSSKNIKFEEYKKRLDGEKSGKEFDNYVLRSLNHEMYLKRIEKTSLSTFDDKRCYINEIESKQWN